MPQPTFYEMLIAQLFSANYKFRGSDRMFIAWYVNTLQIQFIKSALIKGSEANHELNLMLQRHSASRERIQCSHNFTKDAMMPWKKLYYQESFMLVNKNFNMTSDVLLVALPAAQ